MTSVAESSSENAPAEAVAATDADREKATPMVEIAAASDEAERAPADRETKPEVVARVEPSVEAAEAPESDHAGVAPAVQAAAASDEAERARADGEAKSEVAERVEPPVEPERTTPGAGAPKSDQVSGDPGPAPAIVLPRAAPASPLGEALAALDRRDYATARRLFVALGRNDAAEAIDHALAALDRKDYATAQGLFEALKPSMPATPLGPTALAQGDDELKQVPPLAVIPPVAPDDRAPSPRTEKKKSRLLWLAACVALLGIAGAAAFYGSQPNGAFAVMKSQAVASLASAVDLLKAPKAATAPGARSDQGAAAGDQSATPTQSAERPAMGDSGATPTPTTTDRLDRLERETAARFDALGARSDPILSAKLADLTARLDALEKKAASPAASAAPSADLADIAARLDRLEKKVAVAATPASQASDLTTRLDRLEKKTAALVASPAPPAAVASAASGAAEQSAQKFPPSPPPKPSTLASRTQPTGPNANARPDAPRRLLQEYSVETVQGGVAVVDSRYGAQQVGPGDFIPGAGRVLRIERHNGDWYVLTSGGVIAGGPPEYDAPY